MSKKEQTKKERLSDGGGGITVNRRSTITYPRYVPGPWTPFLAKKQPALPRLIAKLEIGSFVNEKKSPRGSIRGLVENRLVSWWRGLS